MTSPAHPVPHVADNPLRPRERLLLAASSWCRATGRSMGALSSVVADHGGALERVEDGKRITDMQIEKFARFLAEPANWPEGQVGSEAREFAWVMGVPGGISAGAPGTAPGAEQDA